MTGAGNSANARSHSPEPWLTRTSGSRAGRMPPLSCGKTTRGGRARPRLPGSAAGITDPEQAVSPDPHRDNPELEAMRLSTMRALEITEDSYQAMSRGELEARVLDGDRAQATAPRRREQPAAPDRAGRGRRLAAVSRRRGRTTSPRQRPRRRWLARWPRRRPGSKR